MNTWSYSLTVELFADDVDIYINIDDIDSFELLQDGLNAFSRWASEWQLEVSINKCANFVPYSYQKASSPIYS